MDDAFQRQAAAMPMDDHAQPRKADRLWLTYALLLALASAYACELIFGVEPSHGFAPTVDTLVILGGLTGDRIWQDGEYWRLFTAPFLHGSLGHIGFNSLALLLAGGMLERLIGWRWFAGIFAASALGGSVASLLINAPETVGVGASGGIVGLFAAAIAASFHFPAGSSRSRLQFGAAQILIPSLLPIFSSLDQARIDYGAHFGGAVAGGLLATLLLAVWPQTRAHPRFGVPIAAIAVIFVLIAVSALVPIIHLRDIYLR